VEASNSDEDLDRSTSTSDGRQARMQRLSPEPDKDPGAPTLTSSKHRDGEQKPTPGLEGDLGQLVPTPDGHQSHEDSDVLIPMSDDHRAREQEPTPGSDEDRDVSTPTSSECPTEEHKPTPESDEDPRHSEKARVPTCGSRLAAGYDYTGWVPRIAP
jgi:hypothetical protein